MSIYDSEGFRTRTSFDSDDGNKLSFLFSHNTNLVSAENLILPVTASSEYCYAGMFADCTSLTTAPELPVTILAEYCYYNMFYGCTSLTTAPVLPATTLAESCYEQMFYGCSNLNHIKCLATDVSATDCTHNWVDGVASSGTFVKNPSMSSWTTGSDGIPANWTVENAS
jgi:hypothetical protein